MVIDCQFTIARRSTERITSNNVPLLEKLVKLVLRSSLIKKPTNVAGGEQGSHRRGIIKRFGVGRKVLMLKIIMQRRQPNSGYDNRRIRGSRSIIHRAHCPQIGNDDPIRCLAPVFAGVKYSAKKERGSCNHH